MIQDVLKEIKSHRNPLRARLLARYFKTGKGQYGEGDIFFGLTVPESRKLALKYKNIKLSEIKILLKNKIHEVRLIGVLILVWKYQDSETREKEKITDFYLKNTKYMNNWDLVDLSAPKILGEHLWLKKDKKILLKLAKSKNLWEERIAIISTLSFVRHGELKWTFRIAQMFLSHSHDLIHKATGWALREAGKKNPTELHKFLDANISGMPRTMLRYAIEKFPESIRQEYLRR